MTCETDYYYWVNKDWLENNVLTTTDNISTFSIISSTVCNQISEIIKNPKQESPLIKKLVKKLIENDVSSNYWSDTFSHIDNIESLNDFIKVITDLTIKGTYIFYNISLQRNISNNEEYVFSFNQVSTTLGDVKFYSLYENEYKQFITDYCHELNIDGTTIYDMEKMLSENIMQLEQKRQIKYTVPIPWSEFLSLWCCDLNIVLTTYKYYRDIDINEIYIDDHNYLSFLNNFFKTTPLDQLKNFIKYKFILSLDNVCKPKKLVNLQNNFHLQTSLLSKSGRKNSRILTFIITYLNFEINNQYIKMYHNPKIEKYILHMSDLIKSSCKDIISKCSWMESVTKLKVIEKIKNIVINVGGHYDYDFDIDAYDKHIDKNIVEMVCSFRMEQFKKNLSLYGKKVDRSQWSYSSYTVNASYSLLNNAITIPYGILQKPFIDLSKSIYTNLGGIGTIIAHEISHAFDDQGRKFDLNGQYNDWWTLSDIDNYTIRIQKFIDHYSSFEVLNNKVSGQLTLGENISDYTSMLILENILKNKDCNKEAYSKLFEAYANIWKGNYSDNRRIKLLKNDVHAPNNLRTNIVLSHISSFKKVCDVKKGDKMYVDDPFNLWF